MSEGRNNNRTNASWLHSDSAENAIARSLLSPQRVAETALRDICNNVRRNLEAYYSSDSSSENEYGTNVIAEREYSFGEIDPSLIADADNAESAVSSLSRVTHRREFSLTSYDSSIFNPEIIYRERRNMTHAPEGTSREVTSVEVNREIHRLREELDNNIPGVRTQQEIDNPLNESRDIMQAMMQEIRNLHAEINDVRERQERQGNRRLTPLEDRREPICDLSPDDVRHYQGRGHLPLKEARGLIPEFDGSANKLQEFLSATTYAVENINPLDEVTLLGAVLCTKLKGRAMLDFQTRKIRNFAQLKQELEACYASKKNTTHLQIEFNTLKQKTGENARAYGLRTDKLAMELYESMLDGKQYTTDHKHVILNIIQQQALENFQIGLNDDIKTVVRSRGYGTLQEAISAASAEEKVKGPTIVSTRPKSAATHYQDVRNAIQCQKCGKIGHHGRECRTSRYATRFSLPKPERHSRVNTVDKYCNHCKKAGHNREECWLLHGRPNKDRFNRLKQNQTTRENKSRYNYDRKKKKTYYAQGSDEEDKGEEKQRPASTYHVSHIRRTSHTYAGLDLVTLPMQEAKGGKVNLLCDTGAAISLIKVGNLKGETMITEDKIVLTGVTGHKIHPIGRINATINLRYGKLIHRLYVVKDDFPTEYEGILGIDFLKKQKAICNYATKQLRIGRNILRLYPYRKITLQPRSETIMQIATTINMMGITRAEEIIPGVFIGNCLVEPENFLCPASVINTNENEVEMLMPQISLEEIKIEETAEVNKTQTKGKGPRRTEKILQNLRTGHLNKEEERSVKEICEEYSDVFHTEGEPLTCTNTVTHRIATQANSAAVNIRPYRLPEKHKTEVNKQVQEMLKNGIIRKSVSQWNAPLLIVPKKPDASGKQKLRVVVDFRKLNDLTIGDSFPLPNITDILDQLGNAKYFTTLDLASGYHQIEMEESDKCKTAFSTPYGHYEFNRMPFGLKNAPATFQRLMNAVLSGLQGIKCLVYLDDIVIFGASLTEHNKRLREVLKRLREHQLKLQPDKCEFLRKEVTYLGHIITENGISPDPAKLEAVKHFPIPKKVKDIQAFIGLAGYYRKFIEGFSKIAKPLTKLTKKGENFEWTQEQQNAFDTLKEKLTTAPVLKYPEFTEEFIVTTDASDYAIGAILSQGQIGQDRPIAYASRVLSKAELNYSTTEKELLAIVWAVKHFRPYLYGTRFTIVTDHKSLVWLFNVTDPGSRLIRWRLKLEEYDYVIIHKAGSANRNADALSRHVPDVNAVEEKETDDITTKKEYTEEEKQRILYEYHDAPLGGHQGIERTINRIRMTHNWKGLTKDVEKYIMKCELCQKNKLSRKNKVPLILTDTADKPFEKCALDIVGPLTITNKGNKYILTFQDSLTKFSKAIPISNQEAATIAKEFTTKIIFEHGIPEKILTDQGTNFLSEVFKNTCKLLKIEKIQTTAYHPESNGALERSHRTLAEYLRHYINADQTDWDEWIPYAMFTYNTTPHTATGFTPFELIYGHAANLPTTLSQPPRPTYTYEDYTNELKEKLRATQQVAKEHIRNEKIKAKGNYDRKTRETNFKVGEKVLLHDETVRRGRSRKLDSLWIGPYVITEKNSDVNYTIKMGRRTMRVHVNRLKAFIEH